MRKLLSGAAVTAVALTGVLGAAGPASAGPASSGPGVSSTIRVHSDGSTVTLSRSSVAAGRLAFKVDSSLTRADGGSNVAMFKLMPGVTMQQFGADMGDEFSQDPATAAKGTRELVTDAQFYGLADVAAGTPATVTENVSAGTYYLLDLASPPGPNGPSLTTLTVHGPGGRGTGATVGPVVRLTTSDQFMSPGTLPAHGTITVRNASDTIHFMELQPVAAGTTDADVQAYFDSGPQAPPSWALDGPSGGMEVLSPGRQAQLTYNLPAGTYVIMCFVSDDVSGMPHAMMGMHKVVTLK